METIEEYLETQVPLVRRNADIVSKRELGQDFMLHIARKPKRYYYPRISKRQMDAEDMSVPRITVSDSLLGCITGYSAIGTNFFSVRDSGLIITKIDFDTALKPNNKLVPDVDKSNEHWLVTYSKDTAKYKVVPIGKIFIHKATYTRTSGEDFIESIAELYIELDTDDVIRVSSDGKLTASRGYWKLVMDFINDEAIELTAISPKEFEAKKKVSAALLSISDPMPNISRW